MVAVASLLVILALSLLVNRLGSVSLELTGLSREAARFQARSAFSGTGFTTTEAEMIVGHPVRRRIVMTLMLIGNIGIVSVIGSVTLSFVTMKEQSHPWVGWSTMAAGLLALVLIARSRLIDRYLCRTIAWALTKWTDLEARDYANLLHLSSGYGVLETQVSSNLAGKTVEDSGLYAAGIVVLGVQSAKNPYEGAPSHARVLKEGDTLVLYGETRSMRDFCQKGA